MSTYTSGGSTGFDNRNLWIDNTGQSTGESFANRTSTSGSILTGNAQDTYSEYTFTANGLTYHYIGEFTASFTGSLLAGTVSASGYYDQITVTNASGGVVASYAGDAVTVDFGSEASGVIGTVTGLLDLVSGLIGGEGTEAIGNLHLDATPSLPAQAFSGADNLSGGSGGDHLLGYNGDDVISGLAGADTIDGGAGSNTLDYTASNAKVSINLTTGSASGGHAAGDSYTHIQNVVGSGFNDTLVGDSGANTLHGGSGNDQLRGGGGNDRLVGGAGDDALTGGRGVDVLFGKTGADTFIFNNIADSGVTSDTRDTISDFSSAEGDKINLSALDANNDLSFIGTGKFTGAGDEVRYQVYQNALVVFTDVDGDRVADFSVKLAGLGSVTADDFIL